jgi:hypothetical protein
MSIRARIISRIDAATTVDEHIARAAESVDAIESTLARQFEENQNTEESPHLQTQVAANTSKWSDAVTWTAPDDGLITNLQVWHVPNSEDALKTRPVVKSEDNERRDIPDYADGGEEFITGEPNDRPYEVSMPIREGEQVVIEAANSNSNYAYRFAVVPTVDYSEGGGV